MSMIPNEMEIIKEFKPLFEFSLDLLFIYDLNGRIISVNDVVIKSLEYSNDEILNLTIFDLVVEEEKDQALNALKQIKDYGKIVRYQLFKVKKKNGGFIHLKVSGIPLKSNEKIYAILGIGHDVTLLKETEKKLVNSEKKYRVLFNNSPSGIAYHKMVYDSKGNPLDYIITGINPQFETILPFSKKDVINKRATEAYQVETAPYIDIYSRVANTQESTSFEAYFPPLDKYFKISVISLEKGKFISVFDDISERKKSEQMLKDSEEKYKALFEVSPFSIVLLDENGIFIDANPARFEIFGSSRDELIGKNFRDLQLFSSKYNQIISEALESLLNGNDVEPIVVQSFNKDGNLIWIQMQGSLLKLGNKTYIQVISENINEKKEAVEKVKEKNIELSVLNRIITLGNESKSLHEFLEKAYDQVLDSVRFDRGGIYLYNPETQHNILVLHKNVHPDFIAAVEYVDISKGLFKTVFDKVKTFYIEDFSEYMENSKNLGVFSAVIVPLRSKDEYVGSMNVASSIHQILSENELNLLVAIGKQMGIIIQKFESEKLLKESEEKFRNLFEQSPDMIIILEKEGTVVNINEAFLSFIHDPKEVIIGMNFQDFDFHPRQNREFFLSKISELNEKGKLDPIEVYVERPNRIVWFEVNVSLIHVGREQFIQGIFKNITIEKLARQQLEESEEQFRIITEQSFLGIVIIQDNHIKYANEAMAKISGYSTEELVGMSMDYIREKFIHHEDLPLLIDRARLRGQSGEADLTPYSAYRAFTKSGELKWFDDYTKIILYQGKEALLVSIMDITEKKEAERLIIEENKKLLELHEMRNAMITRISHELKTPLTSIFGAVQVLLEAYKQDLKSTPLKMVEIANRGAIRLKKLIENLLDISKLDSHKFELKIQEENLVELIEDCINDMTDFAYNRKLSISVDLPDKLLFDVDKLRLEQAIVNIFSNAIKNTPKEGKILINLINENGYVDIQIKDTGVGITMEEKGRLFEKFGKIERYGLNMDVDIEGSGLGLYISKEIVELHDGQILVESEGRDKGSLFTIRLFKKSKV